MNLREIRSIAQVLPMAPPPANIGAPGLRGNERLACPFDEDEIYRFLRCYSEFNFGWKAATLLADNNCGMPIFPHGSDRWFYRCWLLLKDPKGLKYNTDYDPIREAYIYDQVPEHRATREALRAMLLSKGATIDRVAKAISVDSEIIEAYECLFFNVLDRKADALYLRNLVYPDTLMEEMVKGYFEKANMGQILLRMGYNHSFEDVLHFAGFRQEAYQEGMTESLSSEQFQKKIMANGCLLSATGFLNYEYQVPGINTAKTLVTAAKIGGDAGTGGDEGLGDFAAAARNILSGDSARMRQAIAAGIPA